MAPSRLRCTQAAHSNQAGAVTCSLGDIAGGGSATVSLIVRPPQTGTITNTAEVSANETDADNSNNTATEDITVVPVTCDGLPANIIGTPEDDVIQSLSGNDIINGGNGQDIICGGKGDDTIHGNNGIDRLFGDAGNDQNDDVPGGS